MEAKLNGPITFPLKEKYDIVKRTLPLTILREAAFYEIGLANDDAERNEHDEHNEHNEHKNVTPTEEEADYVLPDLFGPAITPAVDDAPASSGGSSSSSSSSSSTSFVPTPLVKTEAKADEEGLHYRLDAAGRNYLYDRHGNRVFKKGTTRPGKAETLRPRDVKQEDWFRLDRGARKDLSDYLKEKDARPAAAANARKRRPTVRRTMATRLRFFAALRPLWAEFRISFLQSRLTITTTMTTTATMTTTLRLLMIRLAKS
jgi:hypothetical protein